MFLPKPAITVAFIGLDGAGKSTQISNVSQKLTSAGISHKLCYFGYSHFETWPIKALLSKKRSIRSVRIRKIITFFYLMLLPIEFLYRRGLGRDKLMLADRHPLYEPVERSWSLGLYHGYVNRVLPKPDIVFYLTGDPKSLWDRKREYDFSMYKLKHEILERLVQINAPSAEIKVITVTNSEAETASEIWNFLRRYL